MKSAALQAAGLLAGLTVVVVLVVLAFGLPVGPSLERVVNGAFGGEIGWSRTLVFMTPLLLCGLGMTLAWRAGMYNIGGEGQYIVGGLFAAGVAVAGKGLPGPALAVAMLLATFIGGALYAALAGWLHLKRGVQVVISTILLNFIAVQLLQWSVQGPLRDPSGSAPQTASLPESAMLHQFSNRTDLHVGVFLAVLIALALAVYLRGTVSGFRLRLVGENPRAARAARIDAGRQQMLAMAMSGGLCGLAGGIQFVGISGAIDGGFPQNWGFLAIPVALLGGLDPLGVLISAFYFGALFAGTQSLSRAVQGGDLLIFVIQGVAVLAFVGLQEWSRRRALKSEAAVD